MYSQLIGLIKLLSLARGCDATAEPDMNYVPNNFPENTRKVY